MSSFLVKSLACNTLKFIEQPAKQLEKQFNRITSDVLFPLKYSVPIRNDKQYDDLHHHSWSTELSRANQKVDELLNNNKSENNC
ncbi:hypothetical protein ABK040_001248 [Willaertia magna]